VSSRRPRPFYADDLVTLYLGEPGEVLAGLCATGLVAKLQGRRAVLVEPDRRLCELGARLLAQEVLLAPDGADAVRGR